MKISISELYDHFLSCKGVCIDTRKITEDVLFVALRGEKFDANTFAKEALAKGAKYALIDNPDYATDERCLLVDDSLKALQLLANYHRQTLRIPVIGLGGSNGKTTTKELVNSVLGQKYKTYATRGNLNNHIGVPLTLLEIDSSVEIAIVELGANHQQELWELCQIGEPTHGLLTNIGKEHLEGFGSLEGVRDAEGELFDFLEKTGGMVVYNGLDETISEMVSERNLAYTLRYAHNATLLTETPFVKYQDEQGNIHTTHLMGRYNFDNIRAAIALGRLFGVHDAQIHAGVCLYVPTNNRSQLMQRGSNTILMDAYNANPSSMEEALRMFDRWEASKKVVILGDMFELGAEAEAEHEALGKIIAECQFDYVLLVGSLMQNALKYLPRAYYFPDKLGLHVWLQDHVMTNTHFLVKGSRGMGLESVLNVL
ncbi:MAG: UDP-N-acetylmuramoyl-tripeptide--D-alanyl-D-alanine ligase [Spirosomataceae bacterium]